MTPALAQACEIAMHVVLTDGTVLKAGRAWLYILEHIGWPLTARFLRLPPMIWCVELGYRFVARNRVFFSKFLYTSE